MRHLDARAGKATRSITISQLEFDMGKGMEHRAGAVMVVGGGIAGVQAALDLTELGYYVYLVEKEAVVGGVMAQLDKTFPTNDCSL
jgi:heterodisulfide reductase subunit A